MNCEPLQDFSVEQRRGWDSLFDEALDHDLTDRFVDYLRSTVRSKGIVVLCIKGFMRSSKSMAAQSVAHMIRFFQQLYVDNGLSLLDALSCVAENQSDAIRRISEGTNAVIVSDETKKMVGQGSETEEVMIQNVIEICARELNHLIFIKPSRFVHPEVCKYGLEFMSRDDVRCESIFMLYDLGNVGGDGREYPLGLVRIRKVVEPGYVPPVGKCYTSVFEQVYEEVVKEAIVSRQKRLDSSSERYKAIVGEVDSLMKGGFILETRKIVNKRDRHAYRLSVMKQRYAGRFITLEINDMLNLIEGRELVLDVGLDQSKIEGEL